MAAAILEALLEQAATYRALSKLAGRQQRCIQHEQTEELLAVLQDRQALLGRMHELEAAITPARADWKGFLGELTDEGRASAEGAVAESRRLLAEINASDERDSLALQQRRHQIGGEIRATAAAVQVNRTYAASAYARQRPSRVDAHS